MLLAAPVAHRSWAQGASLLAKATDASGLVAKANAGGSVRVIVTLPGATNVDSTPASALQIANVANATALGDAQRPTAEQAQFLLTYLSGDATRQQAWAPRLILDTPYLAVNVTAADLEALAANPAVVEIHEDGQMQAGDTLTDGLALIGMPPAYALSATAAKTLVAILDTGVEYDHVFLTPRVVFGTCFSLSDWTNSTLCPAGKPIQLGGNAGTNCPVSTNGCDHGTHVAGIAAGNQASGMPRSGVARAADIIASQVFTYNLTNKRITAWDSDMLASLGDLLARVKLDQWRPKKLAAINLSIWDDSYQVSGTCDAGRGLPFKSIIDALKAVNVATVIISGNDGQTDLSAFPGCVSSAITVSSTTLQDQVSSFSNVSSEVDLFAPGTDIYSSVPPTPKFELMSGTSMAAPFVAGAFAAVLSVCTNSTVDQVLAAFKSTGVPVMDQRDGGEFTKPRIQVDAALRQLGCGRSVAATHDFNGDGKSDLAWRDNTGGTALWLMNGAQALSQGVIGMPPLSWSIVGQRDFDGDGKYDLLWRDTGGNNGIWFMNGMQVNAQATTMAPTIWSVVGTGDFAGTGNGGILWRDTAGNTAIWLMNAAGIASSGSFGNVPNVWSVAATADFDGDGKADILWRDTAGDVAIWFMNGTQMVSASGVGRVGASWSILGTGDFDGDSRSDIVWRDTAGNLAIWFMNGAAIASVAGFGVVPATYSLAQTGDYNGDGRSDLLWQDPVGATSIWFMNGAQPPTFQGVGNIPTATWTLQSLNAN